MRRLYFLVSLLTVGMIGLWLASQSVAKAAEATLPSAGSLPDQTASYWFKRRGEGIRGFFIFRASSRALWDSTLAGRRLAEANALVAEKKPELAKAAFQQFKDQVDKTKLQLESVPDPKKDARTASIVAEINKDSELNLGALHNLEMNTADPDLKKTMTVVAEPVAQEMTDKVADTLHEPALQPEVLDQVQNLLKLGVLSTDQVNQLSTAADRKSVRDDIQKLVSSGDAPATLQADDDVAGLRNDFAETADRYQTYADLKTLESLSVNGLTAQESPEEQAKLAEFQKSYKPGDSIPGDLKKFLLPSLVGPLLTKDLVTNSANVDPNSFQTDIDKTILTQVKSQIQLTASGSVTTQNGKFVMPTNIDVANSFKDLSGMFASVQQQVQQQVVAQMMRGAQTIKQQGSGPVDTTAFRNQMSSFMNTDPNFPPIGFSAAQFQVNFAAAFTPQTFGLASNQTGPQNIQNDPQFKQLFANGAAQAPTGPPPQFQNLIQQFANKPPEEAAKFFAPPPPDQFLKQFQQTGAPPPPQGFSQPNSFSATFLPGNPGNTSLGSPNFNAFFNPAPFINNFQPPADALKAYEQNKAAFDALRKQAEASQQNIQNSLPPAFNDFSRNGQQPPQPGQPFNPEQFRNQGNGQNQPSNQPNGQSSQTSNQGSGDNRNQNNSGQQPPRSTGDAATDQRNQQQFQDELRRQSQSGNSGSQPQPQQSMPPQPGPFTPPTNNSGSFMPPPPNQPPPPSQPTSSGGSLPLCTSMGMTLDQMEAQWQINLQAWKKNGSVGQQPPDPATYCRAGLAPHQSPLATLYHLIFG